MALGDSTTEGMNDPDGRGGYRGWADRLAERIAGTWPDLAYANLAVRGKVASQVLAEQVPAALALRPDLATVEVGLNDALRPKFDAGVVAGHVGTMVSALTASGAHVLVFTMPDPSPFMPLGRPLRGRLFAFNDVVREVASTHGAAVLDLGAHPVASDPRLWSADRLHANPLGHARLADAAADALGLAGSSNRWTLPLPPLPPRAARERVAAEVAWARQHLVPWLARHVRGRSSGDDRRAKRPELLPVTSSPAGKRQVADGA